jgi:hypothetical protein
MNNLAHISWNLDKGTIFMLVAIVAVTAIFATIFYSVATTPHFHVNNNNITVPSYILKNVTKVGWHACQDSPDVVCFGKYTVKEIIPKNITVQPGARSVPIPGPPPQGTILPQAYNTSSSPAQVK